MSENTAPAAVEPVTKMLKQFQAARDVSAPLLAVSTPDPAATIASMLPIIMEDEEAPILEWDVVRGLFPHNKDHGPSARASKSLGDEVGIGNPVEVLTAAHALPMSSILFLHNGHKFMDSPLYTQALWNLRDEFKRDARTIVLLCPQMTLPAEITNDVLVLDEPLPTTAELGVMVTKQYDATREQVPEMPALSEFDLGRATDALTGLAMFPAEQALALSLSKGGIDYAGLWERKRQLVEQTPGLSIYRGKEGFEDIAGLSNIKDFARRMITGKRKPRVIVWMDELEKMLAGFGGAGGGDSSGTSQDQVGQILTWMQEKNARGLLFIGFPGGGKSLMAKAIGNEAGVPTIQMDLGAMKGSLVGQSEQRVRAGIKTVDAVGQGEVLVVATVNSVGNLPPELRRRFKGGTFFFDLADDEERAAAWKLHAVRNEVKLTSVNFDEGWTCAEIQTCCELSGELGLTLEEASAYIVPVARSMREKIEELRSKAEGCYISASYSGIYNGAAKVERGNGKGRQLALRK